MAHLRGSVFDCESSRGLIDIVDSARQIPRAVLGHGARTLIDLTQAVPVARTLVVIPERATQLLSGLAAYGEGPALRRTPRV